MDAPYTESTNLLPATVFAELRALVERSLGDIFPALALAVIHRGELRFEAGWGWIDPETQQLPVTPAALFDLASVSKLFTTAAFLSLVSEGRVALDDALVSVVPEFGAGGPRPTDGGQDPHSKAMLPVSPEMEGKIVDPAQVTLRHLLTHTSGLAPWRALYLEAGPPPTPPDAPDPVPRETRWQRVLQAICRSPFVDFPGRTIRYSDLGMMLVGETVARLHGAPLDSAIRDRVLVPLALNNVLYNPVRSGRPRAETVPTEDDPEWRGRRCWGEVHDENTGGVGGVAGHAGLFGAAREVASFGQAWLERDARLNIAPELMAEAIREQAANDTERRGLGWMLKTAKDSPAGDRFSQNSYGHTGFTGASLWIDPERQLIVTCLSNRVYMGREKPGIDLFRQVIHTLLADCFAT